jgi:hypothetical protein
MNTPSGNKVLPLDDVMLAMDVVDTLRHRADLVTRELNGGEREAQLLSRLRDIYRQQGIEVPDSILKEGVAALSESRFVYTPPEGGFGVWLAKLYVSRKAWGPWFAGIVLVIALAIGGYFFGYLPYKAAEAEAARVELSETLPARMDALVETISSESRIAGAVGEADTLRDRGRIAATEGDRAAAVKAIVNLENLLERLRLDYSIHVVNRDGVKSGFWTYPEINIEATNYYLVVEALDSTSGQVLTLDIKNEENGETEKVSLWGQRVSEQTYRTIEADKRDDGIIENDVIGVKSYGYLDPDYVVDVLGGTVTRW